MPHSVIHRTTAQLHLAFMDARLNDWFAHRDKQKGIDLYLELSSDSSIQKRLTLCTLNGNGPYSEKELEKALSIIRDANITPITEAQSPKAIAEHPTAKVPPTIARKHLQSRETLPTVLQKRRDKVSQNYARIHNLRGMIRASEGYRDDAYRYTLAVELFDLEDQNIEHFRHLDHYKETGEVNAEDRMVIMTATEFLHIVNAVKGHQNYISRYKNDPSKSEEVEKRKAELEQIELFKETLT